MDNRIIELLNNSEPIIKLCRGCKTIKNITCFLEIDERQFSKYCYCCHYKHSTSFASFL